jgi:hypothetical protein
MRFLLDHDAFRSQRPERMNVIDFNNLEHFFAKNRIYIFASRSRAEPRRGNFGSTSMS